MLPRHCSTIALSFSMPMRFLSMKMTGSTGCFCDMVMRRVLVVSLTPWHHNRPTSGAFRQYGGRR